MADTIDDGGSAFPLPGFGYEEGEKVSRSHNNPGMALRDWFAGQALAAMANATWEIRERQGNGATAASKAEAYDAAIAAYTIADAMLAERAK